MVKELKVTVTTKEKNKKKNVKEIVVNENNYEEVIELGSSYLLEKVHIKKVRGLGDLVNSSIGFNIALFSTAAAGMLAPITGNLAFFGVSAVIGVASTTKLLFNKIKLVEKEEEVENALISIYSMETVNGWKSKKSENKLNKNIEVVDFIYEENLVNKEKEVESITLTDESNDKILSNSDKIDNLRKARLELVELKNIPHVKSAVYSKKI